MHSRTWRKTTRQPTNAGDFVEETEEDEWYEKRWFYIACGVVGAVLLCCLCLLCRQAHGDTSGRGPGKPSAAGKLCRIISNPCHVFARHTVIVGIISYHDRIAVISCRSIQHRIASCHVMGQAKPSLPRRRKTKRWTNVLLPCTAVAFCSIWRYHLVVGPPPSVQYTY